MRDGSSPRGWRRIFKSDPRSEISDELSFHLEQRVNDYIARGMEPDAALAAARRRLGELEGVRDECTTLLTQERRTERRRDWMKMSWLDFKLGFRMLGRYPGLTIVGGIAMAFTIWVGAATFEVINQIAYPKLPVPQGDRVVALRNRDVSLSRYEDRSVHDFFVWREQLRTVEQIGAFHASQRNLWIDAKGSEPVGVAEITASAFPLTRVRPLLGRTLVEGDEQPGAPSVVVIGYELWQRRFEGDPHIVGRTVRLGRSPATIVGVMPENFGFPVAHQLWVPLRLNPDEAPGEGTEIRIFGRLARGASIEDAEAELITVNARIAAASPDTHQHLKPRVRPYAKAMSPFGGVASYQLLSINVFVVMLLVLVCANVALLMFARAAARESEIVVRNALGASRGRIVAQLFAEALVLGGVAAVFGLAAHRAGLQWALVTIDAQLRGDLPFWILGEVSLPTVLYSVGLTLLGAVIAGVVPALKVTRGLQSRLRETAAGSGGLKFGGIWTAVIVVQIAVTVAFPATAFFLRQDVAQYDVRVKEAGFPAEQYLTTRFELDREAADGTVIPPAEFDARVKNTWQEFERRLTADAAVAGVTFADRLPLMYHPYRLIEIDSGEAAPLNPHWPTGYRVSSAAVETEFFDELGTPLLEGRNFTQADIESENRVVIVNQKFVELVLGGRNAIGRRFRYIHFEEWSAPRAIDDQPWYEIIGVAPNLGTAAFTHDPKAARIHHPATPANAYPLRVAVHVKGDPNSFTPRLREIAAAIDPALRLHRPEPLVASSNGDVALMTFWFRVVVLVSAVALVLSLAGIYAVMSFTVARRTREIGIRTALGGSSRRIITSIFARPLAQIAGGIVAGAALVGWLMGALDGGMFSAKEGLLLAAYTLLMTAVCMIACLVPTRRALSIQPTEALRDS